MMRVKIEVDGATEQQLRRLMVGLHNAGFTGQLSVGCDGPEHFNARTPKLEAHVASAFLRESGLA